MKKIHAVSRIFAVAAVAFVGNSFAACPLFTNPVVKPITNQYKQNICAITMGLAGSDILFAKNDHGKRALVETLGYTLDRAGSGKLNSEDVVGHLATNYVVSRGKEAINLDGFRDALLQKCDVLPEGTVRNEVNAVVKGIAGVLTNTEVLTLVILSAIKKYTPQGS